MANALFGEDYEPGIMGLGQAAFTGFARVVDAVSNEPVRGAHVRLVQIANGKATALSDTLVTDDRGRTPELTLAVPSLENLYWSVAATGYVEARVPATGSGFETPDEIRLARRVPVTAPPPAKVAKMGVVHYALLALLGIVVVWSAVRKLTE